MQEQEQARQVPPEAIVALKATYEALPLPHRVHGEGLEKLVTAMELNKRWLLHKQICEVGLSVPGSELQFWDLISGFC